VDEYAVKPGVCDASDQHYHGYQDQATDYTATLNFFSLASIDRKRQAIAL
jgi:hypothetical protein